uniref:CCHC-type domain-containing protein n=1 Tax=Salarias fasciatus TaxID=181472 RepID=A0A672FZ10_SALFA
MRRKRHTGGVSTKVHTKTHLATDEHEHPQCRNQRVLDAHDRELLEERIKQLEAELRKKTCVQNDPHPKNDRPVRKLPHTLQKQQKFIILPSSKVFFSVKMVKGNTPAPQTSVSPAEKVTKIGNFCYNCGDDSHMLPQCPNPTNAALVQKKLCERHQARQNQRLNGRWLILSAVKRQIPKGKMPKFCV